MAERVHPREDSPPTISELKQTPPSSPEQYTKAAPPPAAGTYVIQIPKDQVYRVPPPENASRCKRLSSGKPRRRCGLCCCCCCCFLGLLLLAGVAAAIFYLVFRPESPNYSVDSISISGFNLTSSAPLSPEFDVTVRADNPNDKIGIYYESGSSVDVYYDDIRLSQGVLPVFYQGTDNITVFVTALKGSGVQLTTGVHQALVNEQTDGTVPFRLHLRAPVKFKVGSVKTWTITVKVNCDVTVDKLTANANVLSNDCGYSLDIW